MELAQTQASQSEAAAAKSRRLRVLLVEDEDNDAFLVLRQLRRAGYEVDSRQVATSDAFRDALENATWDIIISDYSLPGYSGLTALSQLVAAGKDIPFILISGSIGEAVAVEAMKAGAQDYVLKGDLTRLASAVERELREATVRAEQVKIRERLMISERMASVGTLAAGIAHEINNPLAIVMGNLELTAESLGRALVQARELLIKNPGASWLCQAIAEVDEPLRDAREGAQRIRDIVQDVKLLSRADEDDKPPGPVDLHRVANSSIRMAANETKLRAKVLKDFREVPAVNGNESRLGQVVLNLIVNAAQALPEGQANQNEIRVTTVTADDGSAVIEVADTGCGIPKANLERIFDPFFTTKPVGVGTGIGLAICHRIVSELGGRIEVESAVGKGSVFRIVLPRADKGSGVVPIARPPRSASRARVLVVDDEVPLGKALHRCLSPHHDVTVCTRGADALAHIEREAFDVIFMDIMMPEMTGMEIYDRLRRLDPEQAERVVFLTGGAFSPKAREFLDEVRNQRMEKPVSSSELLTMVETVGQKSES